MSSQAQEISEAHPEAALENLRVLALTSSGEAPETHYLFLPLQLAKVRWNWHIDILSDSNRASAYEELVAPHGRIFARPKLSAKEAWEDNAQVVTTVDARLKEAENKTGVPVGQVVLAATKIGRSFVNPIINLPVSVMGNKVAADNLRPFRSVRRLFKFAEDLLDTTKPDIVCTYEWAKPWLFAVWLAAQRRGIPCIAVRRSKIRSDACFVTADSHMFNIAARDRVLLSQGGQPSDVAIAYIRSFREKPQMVQYIQTKWRQVEQNTWFRWHARWARGILKDIAKIIMLRGSAAAKKDLRRLMDFNRRAFAAQVQKHHLRMFSEVELESSNYIYFPMHKETDLPVNFQAASWFDQKNTVRLLASVLPYGYLLLVREHRHNFGLRPSGYYEELAQLPNVVLIDAFDPQFKYIKNADLIVTENGSSGWEGLLLGRRVLTLSETFYDGSGLPAKVGNIDRLASSILRSLAAPAISDRSAYELKLAGMIDAEFRTTFALNDNEDTLRHFAAAIVPELQRGDVAMSRMAG
jgi:hypothetical protein